MQNSPVFVYIVLGVVVAYGGYKASTATYNHALKPAYNHTIKPVIHVLKKI